MAIKFGVGTLNVMRNLEITGATVLTGSSAGAAERVQINSGLVMIDGITAVISGQSASFSVLTGGINTGSGLLVYAYIDAASTITATAGVLSAADPLNTSTNIPTAICPLARFSFGTGAISVGTFVKWSGGSATKIIAKVQNVNLNVTYENAQMRGGGDIFPVDSQFFNGQCNGSFQFSDATATHDMFFGGDYTGASSSGTWTLSAVSKPEQLSLVFQNVTDGVTSTLTVLRAYLTEQANDFSRTDYLQPTYNWISQANNKGSIFRWEQ